MNDAFTLACSACCLKLRRASIINPKIWCGLRHNVVLTNSKCYFPRFLPIDVESNRSFADRSIPPDYVKNVPWNKFWVTSRDNPTITSLIIFANATGATTFGILCLNSPLYIIFHKWGPSYHFIRSASWMIFHFVQRFLLTLPRAAFYGFYHLSSRFFIGSL